MIDYWEAGIGRMPPDSFQTILDEDEKLLWAVRMKSEVFMLPALIFSISCAALTFFLLMIAPWSESISDYCGSDASRSCRRFYLAAWPGVVASAGLSILFISTFSKSAASPWQVSYAISTKRAFLVDERKPSQFRSVDLELQKASLNLFGAVTFGPSRRPHLSFAGLGAGPAGRAVYWANTGRCRSEVQPESAK
jgi:hypothetical protein